MTYSEAYDILIKGEALSDCDEKIVKQLKEKGVVFSIEGKEIKMTEKEKYFNKVHQK